MTLDGCELHGFARSGHFFTTKTKKRRDMVFKLRAVEKKPLRFWREPMIHFFVLGMVLFGLHVALERKPDASVNDPYLVEVSSADIEWMQTIFKKRMLREPTVQDLRSHVHRFIREQILSREAVSMGLDEGDGVVRRRLARKVEFLFKDLSTLTEPSDEDLQKYLANHRDRYEVPPKITFNQAYFSMDKRGFEEAKASAQALIESVNTGILDPQRASELGDSSILETRCINCSEKKIQQRFGTDFADAVKNLKQGMWHAPVRSAYGFHAVYIYERQNAWIPDFSQINEQVKNDWMTAKQKENTQKLYNEIRNRYRVLVEGLPYEFDKKE
jgi:hypothetical protein